MRVVEVEVDRTRELRARVLRPGQRADELHFATDDIAGTFHLAVEEDGEVVGIVSFVPRQPREWQLRSMAVDPAYERRGIGRLLVDAGVERLRAAGATRVWCNARDVAIGFYERLGWRICGDGFVQEELGIPHHPMELLLSD
jgi:ribosomal protein S18 acetylase RimI-like enzyme